MVTREELIELGASAAEMSVRSNNSGEYRAAFAEAAKAYAMLAALLPATQNNTLQKAPTFGETVSRHGVQDV